MEEKKEIAWLVSAKKTRGEVGAVVEQLEKDVLADTMKEREQVSAQVASLMQAVKRV